jgi:aldehyde:ferredoxin oxidoreductase
MGVFGPNLLVDNLEALFRVSDLCNRFGMDTIGCGGLVGYAVECYERGLITKKQTGGLDLRWGNAEAIVALVEMIGKAEALGGVLDKGFDEAIKVLGPQTAEYAMAVRNEGLPAHDPRWHVGLALTYYLDPTPSRHTQGSTTFPIAGYEMPTIPAAQAAGRAKSHDGNVNFTHVLNSAGLCLFGYGMLSYKTLPEFLQAADGTSWDMKDLEDMGFRLTMARQLFNVQAGWTLDKYSFPKRVLGDPPLESGETKGVRVDLQVMLKEYLSERNLDPKTGLADKKELVRLNLGRFL